MAKTPMWRRYLRFFGSDISADVGDELQFHLESKVAELIDRGWPRELARAEAYRQFGDVSSVWETCTSVARQKERHAKNLHGLSAFCQDLKYGALQLRKNPGTSMLALLALAIGMGVVTAVFSVVYAVVLRPLPFPSPEQLVSVWSTWQGADDVVTPRNFDVWRREAKSFTALGAWQPTTFTLTGSGTPTQIPGGFASAGFFEVFGLSPEIGRTFTPHEDRSPRLHLVVLSHQLWRERFDGDRSIVGKQVYLNREAFTVLGVMPSSFSLRPASEEAWVPLALSGQEMGWTGGILNVVGRLKARTTLRQAQAEMNVLARSLEALYPEMNRHRGIRITDYAADLVGDYRNRLFVLLGAVGFVLMIACANVANLLLARGAGRTQELAVRAALGASRARMIRQLLTESMLVGLLGGAIGIGLAHFLVSLLRKLNLHAVPRLDQAGLNVAVFLFAFGLALLSTILAGLLPSLRAAHVDIQMVLRQGGRGASGLARDPARSMYIAAQVALALVLLIGAGLLIRTAVAAEHIPPGFSPLHLISGRTVLPEDAYQNSQQVSRAYQRMLQSLRDQPGVVSAALTSKVPLSVSTVKLVLKQNSVDPPLKQDFSAELRYISDRYLATMQIPLRIGREFTLHDNPGSAQVALVSESVAHRLWPNDCALGQLIRVPELEGRSLAWEIVGVVADVHSNGIMSEPPPVIYLPFTQITNHPWNWIERSLYLVARTRSDSVATSNVLTGALSSVDPQLPLGDVRTMGQRLARSAAVARFYTLVLAILGACGLLLTVAGIYGVVSYFVNRQRPEIGVRLALGSSRQRVLLFVIRQGMRPVLAGTMAGLLAATAVTRLLAAQLYGVTATDPFTLFAVTLLLLVVAAFACYLPARQAATIDPAIALRQE